MKICLSSDHHYHSYPLFSNPGENGVTTRLAEMLDVEDWLHEYMCENKIQAHFRLGDLFERKGVVDGVVYAEVTERIRRNQQAGIQEYILKGNHDIAAGGLRNTLEAIETGGLATVIGSLPGQAFDLGGTYFVCIPYDEKPGATAQAIDKWVKDFGNETTPKILLAHCAVEGAVSGSEFPVPASVTQAELQLDRWTGVCLGHVHPPQTLKERVLYVGSFCQRYFTDVGAPRRVLIYNTIDQSVQSVELPGPRFETVQVKSKAALSKLPVANNTYYCVTYPRSLARRAVDEHFAGVARGYAPQPDAATVTPAAPGAIDRIPLSATTWGEIFKAYVNGQADGNLDNTRLTKMGLEFLGQTGG